MKENSLQVQLMNIIEDYTGFGPLASEKFFPPGNAMSVGGLFGLKHEQVTFLLTLGLAFAVLKLILNL